MIFKYIYAASEGDSSFLALSPRSLAFEIVLSSQFFCKLLVPAQPQFNAWWYNPLVQNIHFAIWLNWPDLSSQGLNRTIDRNETLTLTFLLLVKILIDGFSDRIIMQWWITSQSIWLLTIAISEHDFSFRFMDWIVRESIWQLANGH